jgi:hypothetical protein
MFQPIKIIKKKSDKCPIDHDYGFEKFEKESNDI